MSDPIFLSRARLGMARPASISTNITPQHGGLAVHYWGPPLRIRSLDHAISVWLNGQRFHMGRNHPNPLESGRHWADIAYNFGWWKNYIFAGRGYFTRSAAQGSSTGNQNFYAGVWLGGEGEIPSREDYATLDWLILDARANGNAGLGVKPHSFFNSTACPGNPLRSHSRLRDGKRFSLPTPTPPPAPAPEPELPVPVEDLEDLLMHKKLIHIGRRGGAAYELVTDPQNPGRYALRPVPNRYVAQALTGTESWHQETVVMDADDAKALRIL